MVIFMLIFRRASILIVITIALTGRAAAIDPPPTAPAEDSSAPCARERPLTNDDVLHRHAAGVGDETLLETIADAPCVGFTLDAESLTALRKEGVSASIIVAMLRRANLPRSTSLASPAGSTSTPSRWSTSFGPRLGFVPKNGSAASRAYGQTFPLGLDFVWWRRGHLGFSATGEHSSRDVTRLLDSAHRITTAVMFTLLYRFEAGEIPPHGFTPYVGGGAGAYFVRERGFGRISFLETRTSVTVGPHILGGVQWNLSSRFGLFAEARIARAPSGKLGLFQERLAISDDAYSVGLRFY